MPSNRVPDDRFGSTNPSDSSLLRSTRGFVPRNLGNNPPRSPHSHRHLDVGEHAEPITRNAILPHSIGAKHPRSIVNSEACRVLPSSSKYVPASEQRHNYRDQGQACTRFPYIYTSPANRRSSTRAMTMRYPAKFVENSVLTRPTDS